jgi:hypothetical protein
MNACAANDANAREYAQSFHCALHGSGGKPTQTWSFSFVERPRGMEIGPGPWVGDGIDSSREVAAFVGSRHPQRAGHGVWPSVDSRRGIKGVAQHRLFTSYSKTNAGPMQDYLLSRILFNWCRVVYKSLCNPKPIPPHADGVSDQASSDAGRGAVAGE